MLKIKSSNKYEFEGSLVELSGKELEEFLMANLSESVQISNDMSIVDLATSLLPLKEFVSNYFVEDAESTICALKGVELSKRPISIKFKKEMIISSQGEILIIHRPEIEFDENSSGKFLLEDVVPEFVLKMDVVDQTASWSLKKDPFQGYKLIDVLDCVFCELYDVLMSDVTESSPLYTQQ